jgi:hypothetical protein
MSEQTNTQLVASIKTNMQEALIALQFDTAAFEAQVQAIRDFNELVERIAAITDKASSKTESEHCR